jgi:hypothetical protein
MSSGSIIKEKASVLDTAVVLLLMGMFVLLAIGVLILGISVYNNTNDLSSRNYAERTALSYISNQLRRADANGDIESREIGGAEALVFTQDFDGVNYLTCLYCYDGQLRELFTEEGSVQEAASGVPIMPLAGLSFKFSDGAITVTITTDETGNSRSLILAPRSGLSGG